MTNTYYGGDDLEEHHGTKILAVSYGYDEENKEYFKIPSPVQPEGSGAGEMISTVLEFLKRMMINKTGPTSEKGMKSWPGLLEDDVKTFIGYKCHALAWETFNYRGEQIVNDSGSVNGFARKMIYIPRPK